VKIWIIGEESCLGRALQETLHIRQIPHLSSLRRNILSTSLKELVARGLREKVTHLIDAPLLPHSWQTEEEVLLRYYSEGTAHILSLARELCAQPFHISSSYVFDGRAKYPYKETDYCYPQQPLGRAQWEGQKRVLSYADKACLLRTSWLFGRGEDDWASTLLQEMRQKRELCLSNESWARPTFARDLAQTVCQLLSHSGLFHYANYAPTTPLRFAHHLHTRAKEKGWKMATRSFLPFFTLQYLENPLPLYSVLDTTKIEHLLQQRPRSWEEGLNETINERKSFQLQKA
jgi:dTDP-4-dehydrorhamnose reductase